MTQKGLLWGHYSWLLMHWLSINLKKEHEKSDLKHIKNIIYNIFYTLPCHTCRTHAKQYTKNNPFNKIKSQKELVIYLYNFHNIVNKRTNKKQFNITDIAKYKNLDYTTILTGWIEYYNDISQMNISDFMLKKNIYNLKQYTINYLRDNIHKFNSDNN